MLLLVLILSSFFALARCGPPLIGENVCLEQKIEVKTVNITYLETIRVKETTWCLSLIPRCLKWKTKVQTKWRPENISRVVNVRKCCSGYKEEGEKCEPVCSTNPCIYGFCIEPEVCKCHPGFSGWDCSVRGCPDPNFYGENCSLRCECENGAFCDPEDGHCRCLPGYEGLRCQRKCDEDHFGDNCEGKCLCRTGHTCHHVTGDCIPCKSGFFGEKCHRKCLCSGNGTALCYHETGHCFCKPNWYGITCETHCPFGFSNGVCIINGTCSCPNDLYECDPEAGCICKEDEPACGGSSGSAGLIDFASLTALTNNEEPSSSSSSLIAVITVILLLALIVTVLMIVYYRRRLKIMNRDLQNRSVYYVENSILNHHHPRDHDLVVTNKDPITESSEAMMMNNATRQIPEKNVNIDNFKLGLNNKEDPGACCATEATEAEADAMYCDVNVFEEAMTSPSREKNNTKIADFNKKIVNKPNVEVIFNNPSNSKMAAEKESQEYYDDEKAYVHLSPDDDDDDEDCQK